MKFESGIRNGGRSLHMMLIDENEDAQMQEGEGQCDVLDEVLKVYFVSLEFLL